RGGGWGDVGWGGGGRGNPPQDTSQSQHQLTLNSRLGIIVGNNRCLECLIIFGIFQRANDSLGCQPVANRIAARRVLANLRSWPCALKGVPAIGFDLPP